MGTKVQARDVIDKAFTTTGTAPAYNIDIPRSTRADLEEATIKIDIHAVAAGAVTLDINSSGSPRPVMKPDGTQLDGGDLSVDDNISLVVDGTEFKITSSSNSNVMGNPTASKSKVRQATRTDAGDHDVYSITGTGITSYSEEDFWVIAIDSTNVNGVSMLDIDTVGEKYIYTPKGDNLNASVLGVDNTYLVRFDTSLDAFTIMQTGDVNISNNYSNNFFDLEANDIGGTTYPLPGMNDSNGLTYDGERYLYIANNGGNTIVKFDTWTNTQVATVGTGSSPWALIEIIGGYLYVACYTSDRVDKIDLSTFTNVGNVAVGTTPSSVTNGNDGYIYVSCDGSDRVDKIDLSTFTNVGNVAVGARPFGGGVKSGYLYVPSFSGGRVDKIDLSTFTNVGNVTTAAGSQGRVVFSAGKIYVNNGTDNTVSVISELLFTKITDIAVGNYPSMKNIISDGCLYVPCWGSDNVYKINIDTDTVVGTPLAVGDGPQEIQLVGNGIYVANETSNNLSYIGLDQLSAPATGMFRLYFKTDGKLYRMDDTGAEQLIGTQT